MSDAYSSFLKAMSVPDFEISVESLNSDFFDHFLSEVLSYSKPRRHAMLVVERRVRLPRHTRVRAYKRERKGDRGKRRGKARWGIVRTTMPNARVVRYDDGSVTVTAEDGADWSVSR